MERYSLQTIGQALDRESDEDYIVYLTSTTFDASDLTSTITQTVTITGWR